VFSHNYGCLRRKVRGRGKGGRGQCYRHRGGPARAMKEQGRETSGKLKKGFLRRAHLKRTGGGGRGARRAWPRACPLWSWCQQEGKGKEKLKPSPGASTSRTLCKKTLEKVRETVGKAVGDPLGGPLKSAGEHSTPSLARVNTGKDSPSNEKPPTGGSQKRKR